MKCVKCDSQKLYSSRTVMWLTLHSLLICGILLCFHISATQSACVHDSVQPDKVNKASISYRQTWERRRRATTELYFPIRIHTEFHNIEQILTQEQERTLKSTVRYTTGTIANILSVIPVLGNLTLKRSDGVCGFAWQGGINKGRCGELDSTYEGEFCMDKFKIPNEHLEGLSLYNYTYKDPISSPLKKGPGVPDSDYVLYVTATTSTQCVNKYGSLIAHAAFCQVDQNSRPIAGHINFCPVWLKDHVDESDRLQLATLHELFHALGFSSKLFEEFRDCSKSATGLDCPKRYKPIRTVYGMKRLVTPSLINLATHHFNCVTNHFDNEFSPILQEVNGGITSHWDEAFLYGSFMSPSIGLPRATVVDPFTLAAMQDSGWYQVRTEQADFYTWGKGEGCQFALDEQCLIGTKYFCTGSGTGCHFMHRHKAKCDTNEFLRQCRVYVPEPQGNCDSLFSKNRIFIDKFNSNVAKRCFMTNITETTTPGFLDGQCFDMQCVQGEIQVRITEESSWLTCPSNSVLQVPGYNGNIMCPEADVICNQIKIIVSDTFSTISSSTSISIASTSVAPTSPEMDIPDILQIQIIFTNAHYNTLRNKSLVATFIQEMTYAVMKLTEVERKRMNNITLLSGSVIYQFLLLPLDPRETAQGPRSVEVLRILRSTITARMFNISLPDGSTYIADNVSLSVAGPRVLPRNMPTGTIVGIVIGCILIVITLSLALFIVQCLCCVQQNRRRGGQRGPNHLPPAWRPSRDHLVMTPTTSGSINIGADDQEFRV